MLHSTSQPAGAVPNSRKTLLLMLLGTRKGKTTRDSQLIFLIIYQWLASWLENLLFQWYQHSNLYIFCQAEIKVSLDRRLYFFFLLLLGYALISEQPTKIDSPIQYYGKFISSKVNFTWSKLHKCSKIWIWMWSESIVKKGGQCSNAANICDKVSGV